MRRRTAGLLPYLVVRAFHLDPALVDRRRIGHERCGNLRCRPSEQPKAAVVAYVTRNPGPRPRLLWLAPWALVRRLVVRTPASPSRDGVLSHTVDSHVALRA